MKGFRQGLLVGGCLTLGFAAGWGLHQPLRPSTESTPASINSRADQSTALPRSNQSDGETKAISNISRSAIPSTVERLATLRWMKANGLPVSLRLFDREGISSQLALLFDLSPTEGSQLNQAYQNAKQRLERLNRQYAQRDPKSTEAKLIVTMPAFPKEGGQAYNELVAAFASVLGSDRYALFNDISGEALEKNLGRFGLESNRLEITLNKMGNGDPIYDIECSIGVEGSGNKGTFRSNLRAHEVTKFFPALEAFPLPTVPSNLAK